MGKVKPPRATYFVHVLSSSLTRSLRIAKRSPRGAEVQHDDLPAVVRERRIAPVQCLQPDLGCRHADPVKGRVLDVLSRNTRRDTISRVTERSTRSVGTGCGEARSDDEELGALEAVGRGVRLVGGGALAVKAEEAGNGTGRMSLMTSAP